MSEEAELIVESLRWLIRCNVDRFIMRGKVLSYEAYYCKLDTKQAHIIWYSMMFEQDITPPGVLYFSQNLAQECAKFNERDWVKERGMRGEVLV